MSRKPKPVSGKQFAANRANAAHSTGPRTPGGNARSAQNSRRHSFTASTFAVVRLEELDEVAHLRAGLISVYHPVNSQELFAINRIALAQQALLRAARLEAGLFTTCLSEALDPNGNPIFMLPQELAGDIEITRAQNRNYALGEGFQRMAKTAPSWSLFLRYQTQAERHYRRAVEEFERLKALRHELPDEPIANLEPEPDKTTYPDLETNPKSAPAQARAEPRAAGPPIRRVRLVGATGLALSGIMMLLCAITPGKTSAIVFLSFGYFAMDSMLPVAWAICLDVARSYGVAMSGAMNMAGQLGSFVSSLAFGYVVELYANYNTPLIVFSFMLVVSAGLFALIHPERPLTGVREPVLEAPPAA